MIKITKSSCYPVLYKKEKDEKGSYYIAYLPDFGEASCHGCGSTPKEATDNLKICALAVAEYYDESNKQYPEPFSYLDK
jgi:predicted RNase H-like HicB family nuclease